MTKPLRVDKDVLQIYSANVTQSFVHLSAEQVRALAHPLRHRILSALRSDGPSTSTGVAERLDSNSGKTSYHLRVLAGVGLVVEETERGDARDRWWRAAHDLSVIEPTDFDGDPDAVAAARFLTAQAAVFYASQIEGWLNSESEWSAEWRHAADMSDWALTLRPAQLASLNAEVAAVIERHVHEFDDSDDPDATTCTVIFNSFPNPHPVL